MNERIVLCDLLSHLCSQAYILYLKNIMERTLRKGLELVNNILQIQRIHPLFTILIQVT
ncbi:MAG: hypothetical protein PWR27_2005 [Petroclostridium sp.]|jgi:hypothetical protein|nr:hypothetical protein [Clostridia bacterium]MDK2811296.1 hypothetical protein [Petroclostridium sp.]